jgi:hypothetical protein
MRRHFSLAQATDCRKLGASNHAYEQGELARRAGVPIERNPWSYSRYLAERWRCGWRAEDARLKFG